MVIFDDISNIEYLSHSTREVVAMIRNLIKIGIGVVVSGCVDLFKILYEKFSNVYLTVTIFKYLRHIVLQSAIQYDKLY